MKRANIPGCPYNLRSSTRLRLQSGEGENSLVVGEETVEPNSSSRATRQQTHRRTRQQTHRAASQRRTLTATNQQTHGETDQQTNATAGQGRRQGVSTTPPRTITAATGQQTRRTASGRGTRSMSTSQQTARRETSRNGGSRKAHSSTKPVGLWPKSSILEFTEEGTDDKLDMWTGQKLLAKYTIPVTCPPDEACSICISSLREPSGLYSDDEDEDGSHKCRRKDSVPTDGSSLSDTVEFSLCHHVFHRACARQLVEHARHHLQCPYCKTIHGVRVGNQPTSGQMRVWSVPEYLPGHPDCDTFVIKYSFQGGVQTQQHPNPGHPYYANDFPRIAYLPASDKGKKVLQLLREAWRRRLIFTVGTSATSGLSNVITWSDIHHKTNCYSNYHGHGYPDQQYLDNVLGELWAAGVTEDNLDTDAGGSIG
ncbi:hypothetical protein Pmani_020748 [Petrolisthes manimaculis]|uniref:E3 ubiquitin-protein ligase n=1 Tax=Petrolisthes manimaculis TaxID=1843537 RepID=A0AAE1PH19_9EUCA|nr:hypothetical protein Pmani_020748 [Petrolisthes manimaculis]